MWVFGTKGNLYVTYGFAVGESHRRHAPRRYGFAVYNKVNCDNEFFIEIRREAASTPVDRSAADYETVKRMTEVASYGNVVVGPSFFSMRSGGLCVQCPIGFASYEELCPPPLNAEIPFVSVTREHLRKAFEIVAQCPNGCVGLTVTEGGKLTIRSASARITLTGGVEAVASPPLRSTPLGVEAASLEFGKDAVDRIILFLVSLHHQYVKLHIHKDLIFRIVAGGSETAVPVGEATSIASTPNVVRAQTKFESVVGFVQSRTVITFYCGHFSCDQ